MNIFKHIRENIISTLEHLKFEGILAQNVDFSAVTAEPPRDSSHGDIATNAAMVLFGQKQAINQPSDIKSPKQLAEIIAGKLSNHKNIKSAEVAGPGFINLKLDMNIWYGLIKEILQSGTNYGSSDIGKNEKTNVEYVSANPTGPMHIGHARGAVVGDVLANILKKSGFKVTREYYINDAGAQVDKLAQSTYIRYREALGEVIGEIPAGFYPGEYLKPVGEAFAATHGRKYLNSSEAEWLPVIRRFTLEAMMNLIKRDLAELGIRHDIFTSERELIESKEVEKVLTELEKNGLIYKGILEPPKGKVPDDWEPREQTLFRASNFGDDVDRPLRKSDGTATYFASDIAYHNNKIKRGYNKMVLTLGADHGGYAKRMKAAVAALSGNKAKIDILIYQLVNFLENGLPMKMSKRAGTFTTVRDVVHAVGKDVVRFIMLTRKSDVVLDFDLQKVTEQSKDNPVFYVQYSHARASSVLRNAAEIFGVEFIKSINSIDDTNLALLKNESEIALIKKISEWPRIVEGSAVMLEPHRIAFYLMELASEFHGLWNLGKDNEALRFISEDDINLARARIALVKIFAATIASGLEVVGIEPVKEM